MTTTEYRRLILTDYAQGMPEDDICKKHGITRSNLNTIRKQADADRVIRKGRRPKTPIEGLGADGIISAYQANVPIDDIRLKFGVSSHQIKVLLLSRNIPRRKQISPRTVRTEETINKVVKLYETITMPEIVNRLGLSLFMVRKILREANMGDKVKNEMAKKKYCRATYPTYPKPTMTEREFLSKMRDCGLHYGTFTRRDLDWCRAMTKSVRRDAVNLPRGFGCGVTGWQKVGNRA